MKLKSLLHTRVLIYFTLALFSTAAISKDQIKLTSGVSPSYKTGLQYKFIKHLTDHEDIKLELKYAPFARRLHFLKTGKIDFLVGLSYSNERAKDIYYLEPPYYSQPIGIFILNNSDRDIADRKNLKNYRIATVINSKVFPEIDQDQNKLEVASIEQMIQLLLSGRIDGFIHNKKGGMVKVIEANASDKISVIELSPPVSDNLYIGISKKSKLYKDKERIELFLKSQKDYFAIRDKHYSNAH